MFVFDYIAKIHIIFESANKNDIFFNKMCIFFKNGGRSGLLIIAMAKNVCSLALF